MIQIHGKNIAITDAMRKTIQENLRTNLIQKYKGIKFETGHITIESRDNSYRVSTYMKTHIGEFKLDKKLEDFYDDFNTYTKILGRMVRDKESKLITSHRHLELEDTDVVVVDAEPTVDSDEYYLAINELYKDV